MGKLHELIAVDGEIKGAYRKVLNETVATFKNKAQHFIGLVKTYMPYGEDASEREQEEHQSMVTTVNAKLDYLFNGFVIPYFDATLQKEATNQNAVADLEINGFVLGKNLPATFLLGLEDKLRELRDVLNEIPTLQPGVAWDVDETHEKAEDGPIYVSRHPIKRIRTKKTINSKIIVEPTKEHPAQVEKWHEDVPVGEWVDRTWSGAMSPAQKSKLLGKLDTLSREVKKARQRANNAEVVSCDIGKYIKEYLLGV